MNIGVLLRVGRDPASFTVNRKAQRIFVHRDEWRTTPADINALETALQLAGTEHAVAVIGIGGPETREALYHARAVGATRALWVTGWADPDAGQIAAALPLALEQIGGAGLVLMGATVRHADLAQVAPRLAAQLGRPFVGAALAVELINEGAAVTLADGGTCAAWHTPLPAVIAIAEDANRPRFAPAPAILRAYADTAAIETVTLADLGLVEPMLRPQTTRRSESFPAERTFGQRLEGSLDDIARQLATELLRKG
ncbi:MAG: hypothetical protein IT317_06545 [Anaerolineales bacterium]|nr:hypothetical protein [Anaerolineales bacterium]